MASLCCTAPKTKKSTQEKHPKSTRVLFGCFLGAFSGRVLFWGAGPGVAGRWQTALSGPSCPPPWPSPRLHAGHGPTWGCMEPYAALARCWAPPALILGVTTGGPGRQKKHPRKKHPGAFLPLGVFWVFFFPLGCFFAGKAPKEGKSTHAHEKSTQANFRMSEAGGSSGDVASVTR